MPLANLSLAKEKVPLLFFNEVVKDLISLLLLSRRVTLALAAAAEIFPEIVFSVLPL